MDKDGFILSSDSTGSLLTFQELKQLYYPSSTLLTQVNIKILGDRTHTQDLTVNTRHAEQEETMGEENGNKIEFFSLFLVFLDNTFFLLSFYTFFDYSFLFGQLFIDRQCKVVLN